MTTKTKAKLRVVKEGDKPTRSDGKVELEIKTQRSKDQKTFTVTVSCTDGSDIEPEQCVEGIGSAYNHISDKLFKARLNKLAEALVSGFGREP